MRKALFAVFIFFCFSPILSAQTMRLAGPCPIYTGSGSPEGSVTAVVCSVYQRTNGGSGTTVYIKESGSGNTGWVAVASGGGVSLSGTNTWTGAQTFGTVQHVFKTSAAGANGLLVKENLSGACTNGCNLLQFQTMTSATVGNGYISWLSNEDTVRGVFGINSFWADSWVFAKDTGASSQYWLMDRLSGNITHAPINVAIATNANAYGYWLKPAFTEAGSGTHALIAGMRIDTPTITNAGAAVTDTATLYVAGAASSTVNGKNYGIWSAAGSLRADDTGTPLALKINSGAYSNTMIRLGQNNSSAVPDGMFAWFGGDPLTGNQKAKFGFDQGLTDGWVFYGGSSGATSMLTIDRLSGQMVTAGTVPTISSGFGASPSIVGGQMAGRVTVGTGGTAITGVIAFNATWAHAPLCVANDETGATILPVKASATTTQLTLASTTAWGAGDTLTYVCVGY